jgi:hypothetical protein
MEICADGLGGALFDETEQFGFEVVASKLERELLDAVTVTRLREDFVDGMPNSLWGRMIGA